MLKMTARLLLFILPVTAAAQEKKTIQFKEISYQQALQEATATGKPVFIDCYTSWCAPCKWMDKNVFVNDTVYAYYNAQFINLKIDMEKGEGIELKKKYAVQSFPTYLFVDGKGNIVHRTASKMSVQEFYAEAQRAVAPGASLAELEKKYNEGNRTVGFLYEYAMVMQKVDREKADKLRTAVINTVTDEELRTSLGWKIIQSMARDEQDRLGGHFQHRNGLYFFSNRGSDVQGYPITILY